MSGHSDERVEPLQELVGVGRNLEEPLDKITRDDRRAAAPAGAVDHLFVGEHGLAARAPVHRRALAVRDPPLEHLEEDPLVELVVLGQAGGDLAVPGVADAEALQLPLHVRDVVERRCFGVRAGLDRGVLGGQAERVPPERVQHVEAPHALHPRHHVADDVVAHVPDVRVAGRVREHLEAVELRPRRVRLDLEGTRLRPLFLPLLVQALRLEFGHERLTAILVPSAPRERTPPGRARLQCIFRNREPCRISVQKERQSMVIKRIGPMSCARITGTLYAAMGLVFGAIFSLLALAGFAPDNSDAAGLGAMIGVGAIIAFPILYGCIGFVATIIGVWLYNVMAGLVGGIEMDVQ